MKYFKKLLHPTSSKRFFFFFLADIFIIIFSLYLSFILRFDFRFPNEYKILFFRALPLFVLFKLLCFMFFNVYKFTWRYIGIKDIVNIIGALAMAEAGLMIFIFLKPFDLLLPHISQIFTFNGFPRSIFIMDTLITLVLMSGLRISKRLYLEVFSAKKRISHGKRTLILGAGNTGEMIIRDISKKNFSEFYPIGFLDDDKRKIGTRIHGVKVLGPLNILKEMIFKHCIEAVIIAIPSLNHKTLVNIYKVAKDSQVNIIKIVPRIYGFHKPEINLKSLEEISIEDLIGRQEIKINHREIEDFLKDKNIIITGAGGSIGSEITLQVCAFYPNKVILFDIDETALHNISIKLYRRFPHLKEKIFIIVGDIKDEHRIREVFNKFNPQIVFHAAAYKHVPMMEYNPTEAVKVNIFGTYNLVKASLDHGVKKFILISTDKAVNPTSVMGGTKRIAEYICKAYNEGIALKTEFISVRFGNVLGSRGSVLPLFLEQLKLGGPITVTHKDMKRYFMTIPEAVSLVLQASVIGKGGEILVLDMGEHVKILEIAEELIRIHGLKPYEDIDIEFVGMRPGEKLFEEILTAEEGTIASKHERVYIAKNSEKYSINDIKNILAEFEETIKNLFDGEKQIQHLLKKYVKYFDTR